MARDGPSHQGHLAENFVEPTLVKPTPPTRSSNFLVLLLGTWLGAMEGSLPVLDHTQRERRALSSVFPPRANMILKQRRKRTRQRGGKQRRVFTTHSDLFVFPSRIDFSLLLWASLSLSLCVCFPQFVPLSLYLLKTGTTT